MKKFFALLLVVLMLVPFVVACGDDETTTTATEAPAPIGPFSSKDTVLTTWSGKTLTVAATSWYGSGAPWAIPEIFVTADADANFGAGIQDAVLKRAAKVKELYGVDLYFFKAGSAGLTDKIQAAQQAGEENWDIAYPRLVCTQELVVAGLIYDLANREYIDLENDYYNDLSVKTWTAKGHTFYLTGDFSFLDKQLAFILYFNKDLLEAEHGNTATADLYKMVKDGNWTWSELVTLANGCYNDDGNGEYNDGDSFGMSVTDYNRFFQYFGISEAGVDQATGEWKITLNTTRTKSVIDAILAAKNAEWVNGDWGGSWGGNAAVAMKAGRLLFYNEVIQKIDQGEADGNVGLVPFPKLNASQDRYYAPAADTQVAAMCIPKITQDRVMSDYFIDVLSWTGEEYLIKAYLEGKADNLDSQDEVDMLHQYIFPNITYEGGLNGWGTLAGSVKSASWNEGSNKFTSVYADAINELNVTIEQWNQAWAAYAE